jgi:cell division protein FtsI/penicillin-binding protein 2
MAEKFGFNQAPSIPGVMESTIPSAKAIGDSLAVGSSAIGQGMVQATSLEMTEVAATIAMGGRRPIPTLLAHQRPRFVRVTSPRVAHEVQKMMIAVVDFGTGTAAQIPGVVVAGKTGTAELSNTSAPGNSSPQNTDAWFVGYAPVGHPKVVAGALFPNQGAGGAAAAPPVHDVLAAALGK